MPELQVDIVPREERDDAAMMPRVPQPMSGAMAGKLHCLHACITLSEGHMNANHTVKLQLCASV